MKRCRRCGLPETYPGIQFGNDRVCNYCVYFDLVKDREEMIMSRLKDEFSKTIRSVKEKGHTYDCVLAYSGGKDSTYLLYYLKKKFGLNILAHTFDNGFISGTAMKNIKRMTNALQIDSRITRPKLTILKKLFRYALTDHIPYPDEILSMMSQVCAVCIGMVFGTTLNVASELKIPLMFIGFTPGQYPAISLENYFKVKSCLYLSDKVYRDDPLDVIKIVADPVSEKFGEEVREYFFKSQYYQKGQFVPKVLFPFHALLDYDENEIINVITGLGWERPEDTDTCSTNCLINTAGNFACVNDLKYHPYIGEMSYLVRKGRMSRREAIQNEKVDERSPAMENSLKRLKLSKRDICSVKGNE